MHSEKVNSSSYLSKKKRSKFIKFHFTSFILLSDKRLINVLNVRQISHKINRVAFGDYFPGVVNPLDG
jgi:hypothetical protein